MTGRYTAEIFLGCREDGYVSYSLPMCCDARCLQALANTPIDRGEWLYIRTFKDARTAEYWCEHGIVPKN